MSLPCPDCGTTLVDAGPAAYTCTNAACPGGPDHYLCGFCKLPSFSLERRECTNAQCRTHRVVREPCPTCSNYSRVTVEDQVFCINRRCPDNTEAIERCPSCGTDSRLRISAFAICVKSTCRDLLTPLERATSIAPVASDDPWGVTVIAAVKKPMLPDPWGLTQPAAAPPGAAPVSVEVPRPDPFAATIIQDAPDQRPSPPRPAPQAAATAMPAALASASYVAPPVTAVAVPAAPVQILATAPANLTLAEELTAIGSEMERALLFLERTILSPAAERSAAPVILVFGLAGSGKSTYLTMLGEILGHGDGKYHFPYPGITVRSLQLDQRIDAELPGLPPRFRDGLHRRIRDLTYGYAAANYTEHLANGAWVPATVRETGDHGQAQSCFLISEVVRNGHTIGHLVTVETSGEDYEEVLRKMASIRDVSELATPQHRVLFRLLERAAGLILLLDPGSSTNDQDFAPFLRLIKDAIEPRVAGALGHLVDLELQSALGQSKAAGPADSGLAAVFAREQAAQRDRDAVATDRQAFAAELAGFERDVAALPRSHAGVEQLLATHKPFIDELEVLVGRALPELVAQAEAKFAAHGRTAANYLFFYAALVDALKQREIFDKVCTLRRELAAGRATATPEIIQRILQQRGLESPVHEGLIARHAGGPGPRRLRGLRHLGVVVTKADRHPIISPPGEFARFKLPSSHPHLTELATYLALLGGGLRSYNATAVGYAVQRGDSWLPGPGNSFTPVNIIEPLFDILLAEADVQASAKVTVTVTATAAVTVKAETKGQP